MKEKLELKSGLEIHQQLDSHKLFCNCPSMLRQDAPDVTIKRKLHIIAGESGEIDEAVKFEAGKEKAFEYQGYFDNCCLVEYDESPPYSINQEALKIALQISLLLNCEVSQYSQIMRKTVIDGSNTSGFQRTVLVARNGYIETSFGKVGIDTIYLEEDSCRPAGKKDEDSEDAGMDGSKSWKLDRLGIPLVEIATGPHMNSPEQIKEAALKIGEILRACNVRRGIGTIRQDVNISIKVDGKSSERVEIKGFQDPAMMIQTVNQEVERQKKCLKTNSCKREVRRALDDGNSSFLRPMPGAARMYPETDLPLLHISREMINDAKKDLPRMRHEIKSELKAQGLGEEMINLVLSEDKLEDYRELLEVWNNPNLVAKIIVLWKKEISSREKISEKKIEEKITLDIAESILTLVRDKKIDESQAKSIMLDIVQGKNPNEALKPTGKLENLEEEVFRVVKEKPGLSANAYMGLVMQKLKGVSGKEVMEILRRLLK